MPLNIISAASWHISPHTHHIHDWLADWLAGVNMCLPLLLSSPCIEVNISIESTEYRIKEGENSNEFSFCANLTGEIERDFRIQVRTEPGTAKSESTTLLLANCSWSSCYLFPFSFRCRVGSWWRLHSSSPWCGIWCSWWCWRICCSQQRLQELSLYGLHASDYFWW